MELCDFESFRGGRLKNHGFLIKGITCEEENIRCAQYGEDRKHGEQLEIRGEGEV